MRKSLVWRHIGIPTERHPAVRKTVIGERVIGIFFNRLLEISNGFLQVRFGPLVPEESPFEIAQVSFRVRSVPPRKVRALRSGQGYPNFIGNSLRNFTLQRKYVFQPPIVS